VRRSGAGVSTGRHRRSTRRSLRPPPVDDHLGERLMRFRQRTVASTESSPSGSFAGCGPARGLGRDRPGAGDRQGRQTSSTWRPPGDRPAGPSPASAIELAGMLHPTPRRRRRPPWAPPPSPSMTELGAARPGGWYAAPRSAGWTRTEDGEFCVALRSALPSRDPRRPPLRRRSAVVPAGSDPREPSFARDRGQAPSNGSRLSATRSAPFP